MRVAVATICYNEEQFIGAVIRNWKDKVYRHVIFLSSKPWHGHDLPHDKTWAIARSLDTEVVSLPWPSETAQRNFALGYLYDADYVLNVDADELYVEKDQLKILESLGNNADEEFVDNTNCYKAMRIATYFKTPEYILDPPDRHLPSVAINPKKALFRENRGVSQDFEIPLYVTMHHLSYLRNDIRLYHKFQQFEHYDQVKKDWYTDVWKQWTPDMENVRAYGGEKSKAVKSPMPDELIHLLTSAHEDVISVV